MRIAIVDVGTNTSRLFVAEVEAGRVTDTLVRISRVTRLGAGVESSGRLSEAAIAREDVVLEAYAAQIAEADVDRAVAVMTSAVRDAADGAEFAARVAGRYGLEAHILTGEAEAGLTYRGASDAIDPDSSERILVVDIGGGSTELILGTGIHADFHASTQAGVVRQADRHFAQVDAPTPRELTALCADVAATLAAAVPKTERAGVQRTLAVAGTPTSLAAIDLGLDPYDPERAHGHVLSRRRVEELSARLSGISQAERRRIPGLNPDRAEVIVPGSIILLGVMDLFGLDEIEVSEHDILRGAAVAFAESGPA